MELTSKGMRAACISDAIGTKARRIFGATAYELTPAAV